MAIAVPNLPTRRRPSVTTSAIGHASRLAGDGAHRDIERGQLGPDRVHGVVTAFHVWHAQISH